MVDPNSTSPVDEQMFISLIEKLDPKNKTIKTFIVNLHLNISACVSQNS
jgi:hypothetical protein